MIQGHGSAAWYCFIKQFLSQHEWLGHGIKQDCDSPQTLEQDAVMLRLIPNMKNSPPKVLKQKAMYIDDKEVEETRERLETMEIDGTEV